MAILGHAGVIAVGLRRRCSLRYPQAAPGCSSVPRMAAGAAAPTRPIAPTPVTESCPDVVWEANELWQVCTG